ncbi:hypothetical protein [Micromonospora sp. CB01531]|uniref:hypothetical protein n=1 Tax=Micromonospora sp. CB01531 TaxID=1718947 RepID=UPI00093D08E8|nr:hypothetical protein [Micromonospora sp. CB01531]OKI62427.1 hypothetical protein A6A27_05500 [Micromonospora sp. CB01531]
MRPPRRPRDWLARALRVAADRLSAPPPDRLATPTRRLASPAAERHAAPAAEGLAAPTADRPAAWAAVDQPALRRPGEPPEHWLRLVAAHAPGLLHDLSPADLPLLDLPAVDQGVSVGSEASVDANPLIDGREGGAGADGAPGAGGWDGGSGRRGDRTVVGTRGGWRRPVRSGRDVRRRWRRPDAVSTAGSDRPVRSDLGTASGQRDDGERLAPAGGSQGRAETAGQQGLSAFGHHGDTAGTASGIRSDPAPTGSPDRGEWTTGERGSGATAGTSRASGPGEQPATVRGTRPGERTTRTGPGERTTPTWSSLSTEPSQSAGPPTITGCPGHGDGLTVAGYRDGPASRADRGTDGNAPDAGPPPRDGGPLGVGRADPAAGLRIRLSALGGQQMHSNGGSGRTAVRADGSGAASGPAVAAAEWSERAAASAARQRPPRTAAGTWPALPDETRGAPPAGAPGAVPDGRGRRDPWPTLPDDRELWLPAASTVDAARLRRLDREQAGS